MIPIVKGAIGLGGIGSFVGAGFLVNSFINKKQESNLRRRLKDDKFTPLNLDTSIQESDNSKWQTIFTSYSSLTEDKSNLKIENLTLNSSENKRIGINQLKKSCSNLLDTNEESPNFNKNYRLASQWCVEPISVEEILKRRGVTYLDTTGSGNSKEWEEIAKKYEKVQTTTNKPLREVTWTAVTNDNYSTNIGVIKNACNTRKGKNSHQEGFLNSLEESQTWCSINTSQ